MNTLAHIAALVAAIRLSVYGFVTLADTGIGVVCLLLAIWVLGSTTFAVMDDVDYLGGRPSGKERGE